MNTAQVWLAVLLFWVGVGSIFLLRYGVQKIRALLDSRLEPMYEPLTLAQVNKILDEEYRPLITQQLDNSVILLNKIKPRPFSAERLALINERIRELEAHEFEIDDLIWQIEHMPEVCQAQLRTLLDWDNTDGDY